jgi:hypothetical protein
LIISTSTLETNLDINPVYTHDMLDFMNILIACRYPTNSTCSYLDKQISITLNGTQTIQLDNSYCKTPEHYGRYNNTGVPNYSYFDYTVPLRLIDN